MEKKKIYIYIDLQKPRFFYVFLARSNYLSKEGEGDETNVLRNIRFCTGLKSLNRRFELDPTGWNAITCRYISRRDNTGQTGVKTKTNPSENRIRCDVG